MTDVLYFSSSYLGFPNNIQNDYRVQSLKRLYSISPSRLLTISYEWSPASGAAEVASIITCSPFVSSSFYQNDYDIDSSHTSLYQYDNKSNEECAFQSPYIMGVRGARTLRTNNVPYSIMKSNQNANVNSGTFFSKGSIS